MCCICLYNDDIIVIISCNVPIYFLMSVARNNRVNRVYYFKRARQYRQIKIMKKKLYCPIVSAKRSAIFSFPLQSPSLRAQTIYLPHTYIYISMYRRIAHRYSPFPL